MTKVFQTPAILLPAIGARFVWGVFTMPTPGGRSRLLKAGKADTEAQAERDARNWLRHHQNEVYGATSAAEADFNALMLAA